MPADATLLLRTLVALADSLVDDFDVVELLTMLSQRCVDTLDVAAAGVMLATPTGALQVVASSSEQMRTLELWQLQSDEGPCVDCFRTGSPIVNLDLDGLDGRWPVFTPKATAAGYRSVHSLPMRLRGTTIGALNMFRTSGGALAPSDVVAAQALADIATITILQHQALTDVRSINDQLQHALQSRITIEQAKGRISEATGVEMEAAFDRLRAHARRRSLRLTELATGVAEGTVAPADLDVLDPS